jgi:hypothetical protein
LTAYPFDPVSQGSDLSSGKICSTGSNARCELRALPIKRTSDGPESHTHKVESSPSSQHRDGGYRDRDLKKHHSLGEHFMLLRRVILLAGINAEANSQWPEIKGLILFGQ